MSAGAFLIGRAPDGADKPVAVNTDGAVKVDIGSATLNVDANGVEIKNDTGNPVPVVTGLGIPEHDYIGLAYTGDNLTGVTYKLGGSGGVTVATLTLAYTNSRLDSVIKS